MIKAAHPLVVLAATLGAARLALAQPAPPAPLPPPPPDDPAPPPDDPPPPDGSIAAPPDDGTAAAPDAAPSTDEPTQVFDEVEVETELKKSFRLLIFGDMNAGAGFGAVRDQDAAAQFAQFGLDDHVKNTHRGFGLAGTDFVLIGELSRDVHYLGEINFQVERGESSEFEIDVERMFIDYNLHERLNVQAGLFFTPIGYHNRKQYSRAWLSMSATVPALFEEEYGLVPTHTIGVQVYGTVPAGRGDLTYAASFGNGRAVDPTLNLYSRDRRPSAVTAGVEYQQRSVRETAFGLAGWFDQLDTYRVDSAGGSVDIRAPGAPKVGVRELGLNAYLASDTEQFGILLEYVMVRHQVTEGAVLPQHQRGTTHGVFAELAYHATPRVHPYVRYDRIELPADGGVYYPLRLDGDRLARFYVPDEDLIGLGIAWDRTGANRLKLEYSIALAGPRPMSSILVQTAFGLQ